MTKNPFLNALAAALYIVIVASVMYYGVRMSHGPDTILAPIAIISLFTLSAAVMGYLFLWQPILLYLEGDKIGAAKLFIRTVGVFAGITACMLFILFSGIL